MSSRPKTAVIVHMLNLVYHEIDDMNGRFAAILILTGSESRL